MKKNHGATLLCALSESIATFLAIGERVSCTSSIRHAVVSMTQSLLVERKKPSQKWTGHNLICHGLEAEDPQSAENDPFCGGIPLQP
eukprot:3498335-Amphidinium_carterae.1